MIIQRRSTRGCQTSSNGTGPRRAFETVFDIIVFSPETAMVVVVVAVGEIEVSGSRSRTRSLLTFWMDAGVNALRTSVHKPQGQRCTSLVRNYSYTL